MSRRQKNQPIGEIECPQKGCELKAGVFKFRERSQDEKLRRFAGRFYSLCEKGHKCNDSEHIAEKGHIWGADEKRAVAPVVAAVQPAATKPPASVKKTPEKIESSPVQAKPPAPAIKPESKTETPARRWGWF